MENSKEKGLPLFLFFKNRKKNLPFSKTIRIFAAETTLIWEMDNYTLHTSYITLIRCLILSFILSFAMHAMADGQVDDRLRQLIAEGNTLAQAEQYSDALERFTTALKLAEKEKHARGIYISCINIGNTFTKTEDYSNAFYYYKQGLEAAIKSGDEDTEAMALINLVGCCAEQKDIEQAKQFNQQFINTKMRDLKFKHYYTLYNNSVIAKLEGKYDLARYYILEAMKQMPPNQHTKGLAHRIDLGDICMEEGNFAEAATYYISVLDSAQTVGLLDYSRYACEHIAEAYEKLGKQEEAVLYRNRALAIGDTLFNQQQMNLAKSKLNTFEREKRERKIFSLNTSLNLSLFVITFVGILLLLSLIFLYVIRKKNQNLIQSYQLLIEKNADLSKQNEQSKLLREQYLSALDRIEEIENDATAEKPATAQSPYLNDQQMTRLAKRITAIMEDVDTISNPDFSQSRLVELTGSNSTYVSNVINNVFGKNFKTLLNEYRIREACKRLVDKEHYGNLTIEAIYRELGYVSPTVFINAFKKVNGMTPSQYQKLARAQNDS